MASNAGIQIKLQPVGFPEVEDAIKRLMLTRRGLRGPLTAAGRFMLRRSRESFERQESPDGVAWAPLSPRTLALRAKKKGPARNSDKMLFVTGHLMASLAFNVSDTEMAFGTNRKFPGGEKSAAAIHQLGGQAGRGRSVTIPARPFIGMTDDDARVIGRYFVDEVRMATL